MIEAIHLQVKLKLCTSFIVKEVIALDPQARRGGLPVPPYLEKCEKPSREWKWQ